MAAVVVKGGRVISIGINKKGAPKRFTLQRPNMNLHAEVVSLLNVDRAKTKGATLYINGETENGTLILTKPCFSCYDIIETMGIKRIVYSNQGELKEIK